MIRLQLLCLQSIEEDRQFLYGGRTIREFLPISFFSPEKGEINGMSPIPSHLPWIDLVVQHTTSQFVLVSMQFVQRGANSHP